MERQIEDGLHKRPLFIEALIAIILHNPSSVKCSLA